MTLVLAALGVLAASGAVGAVVSRGRPSLGLGISAWGAVLGAVLGGTGAVMVLLGAPEEYTLPLALPGTRGALRLDPLGAWFLLTTLVVSALAAVYGRRYLLTDHHRRPVASQALFFNLLVVAMALVFLAGDALVFLIGWETMTLCAFLLVTYEHEREEVRAAGLLYLVLTHVGSACLLGFFAWLGALRGSLALTAAQAPLPAATASGLLALATVGFGAKAGVWPLHIWLPAAHPVAPTHASAVLSGLVLKSGIYGLLRAVLLVGTPPAWIGHLWLGLGIASALLGVLNALAQHELKRLLAYHSIENIGIILMGIGVGAMGMSTGHPALAALGFAGALLHVTNHALFKSLLFLGAGAVLRARGHLAIDRLGGLARSMPWTAGAFLVGAAAISGLPPLNGFASELLVYLGLFHAAGALGVGSGSVSVLAAAALALVGGLAAACFAKAFGAVFLGTAREEMRSKVREAPWDMRAPMLAMALCCAAIGLGLPALLPLLGPAVAQLAPGADLGPLGEAASTARSIALGAAAFGAAILGLAGLRAALVRGRPVGAGPTWGCGYAQPSARMQYTAASFAAPLVRIFRAVLLPARHQHGPEGLFPARAETEEHAPDVAERLVYAPALAAGRLALGLPRRAQSARVHAYVLAVFATLLVLLLWRVVQ